MSDYRIEEDTLGAVKIPVDALWGAQTERSRNNFSTGAKMPLEIIKALLQIKKAAAIANKEADAITDEKADLIVASIDRLLALDDADLRKDFPLVIYQTGSDTTIIPTHSIIGTNYFGKITNMPAKKTITPADKRR